MINNVFVIIISISLNFLSIFALIKQTKINYIIIYYYLFYYSHERLIVIAKTIGIIYLSEEYANFDYNACYAYRLRQKLALKR